MKSIAVLNEKLHKLNILLQSCDRTIWADSIPKIIELLKFDPDTAKYEILRLFGGVGSLNDLVLYLNGQPLIKENDELDKLRSEIYNACVSYSVDK